MDKPILFIAALHGDEGFGVDVLKRIEREIPAESNSYHWIIGNPNAYEQNVRFTQADLNRVAPGNIQSAVYEEKRAAELIELSDNYDYAIDIHGTNANTGIFTLVTNPTIENLLLASSLPIQNVVIWAANTSKTNGPVTQYLRCPAVEIECGPKASSDVSEKLKEILIRIIKKQTVDLADLLRNASDKQFFQVYGSIEQVDTTTMKEFEQTQVAGESFYPLLVNSYVGGSARKMKKIDFFDVFSY